MIPSKIMIKYTGGFLGGVCSNVQGEHTSLQVTRCWVRVELSRQASTFSTPALSSSSRSSLHPPPSSLSWTAPACPRVQGWHEYTTLSGKLDRISYRSSGRKGEQTLNMKTSRLYCIISRGQAPNVTWGELSVRTSCPNEAFLCGVYMLPVWVLQFSPTVRRHAD